MNILSFDIGTFSTKVSYILQNGEKKIKTKEYKNIVLFKNKKEIIIGEKASKLILSNIDQYKNNYVSNFVNLLNIDSETFFNKKEQFFTFAEISEKKYFEILIEKKTNPILPCEILFLFLKEILEDLKKNFLFSKNISDYEIIILINQNCSIKKKNILKEIFLKLEIKKKINFFSKSLSLAYLHAKMNNFIINKRILFIDIGYSEILMSIIKINNSEIFLEKEKILNLGIRDFDYQMYLQILRDLSEKYNVDYKYDKNIKFKILSKLNKLKRSFKLKKKCVIELEKIFGDEFINKNISFDQKSYEKQNSVNFSKFKDLFKKNFDMISSFDNLIQDCQVIGGGSKIKKFVKIILKKLQVKFIYDKLAYNYSCSQGCLLRDKISADVFFINNVGVKYEIVQLKKIKEENNNKNDKKENFGQFVIKDEFLFKENEKINLKENEKIIEYIKTDVENHFIKFLVKNKKENKFLFEIDKKFEKIKINYDSPQEINFITLLPGNEIYYPIEKRNRKNSFKNLITTAKKTETKKNEKEITERKNENKEHNHKKNQTKIHNHKNCDHKKEIHNCEKENNNHNHNHNHNCESHLSHSSTSKKKNPLVNATYLHIYSDLAQDIFLLFLAIGISYKPSLKILDPIISIMISLVVLFFVIRYSITLLEKLMDRIPNELNYNEICNEILDIEGVEEIHDLHIREISEKKYDGSVHLIVSNDKVLKLVTMVFRKFGIYHSTVQIEEVNGKNEDMYVNCDNNIDC